METLILALRQDPYALETVFMTIITSDAEARTIVPITPLEDIVLPQITTPRSGPTHPGLALESPGREGSVRCGQVDGYGQGRLGTVSVRDDRW
jgi:uncharacterized protein YegL